MVERQESGTTQKTEREEGLELALQLMGASSEQLAWTTNTLIDSLTAERDTERATVDAIRDQIGALLDGPYMPTPRAIIAALWPSDETIDQYRKAVES